ncbi:MAG: transposase [Gammaproteobacteria bacterium]|nr:transposase [Gammaproteobacteria bacterium]MCW5583934.1 transposase [Gammaproteobacteria bacterium]
MQSLPRGMAAVLNSFSHLFTFSTWAHVQVLLMGAILCQGARRVSSILRVMGLSHEKRFEKYHRVLNRAKWNSLTGAKILLVLLIQLLPAAFPILIVVDDTIERRGSKKIKAKGCYRDACRSTEKLIVKCFGLKWVCLMLVVPLPWCKRPWALPFMTILAPSKKANKAAGKEHKTSIDWTMIGIRVISRWLKRAFILIGDGGFACIKLGHACIKHNVTLVSRLRLDVALYELAPTPGPGQVGRRREKGKRVTSLKELAQDITQPWRDAIITWYDGETKQVRILSGINLWYSSGEKPLLIHWVLVFDPVKNQAEAFFSTDVKFEPEQIVNYFVLRWNIEVTFFETRAHLGIETQRQWSDKAIARSTPMLMSLFSFICLFAIEMLKNKSLPILSSAWYDKKGEATFADILAFVRRDIWAFKNFNDSRVEGEYVKIKQNEWEVLLNQLAHAA